MLDFDRLDFGELSFGRIIKFKNKSGVCIYFAAPLFCVYIFNFYFCFLVFIEFIL